MKKFLYTILVLIVFLCTAIALIYPSRSQDEATNQPSESTSEMDTTETNDIVDTDDINYAETISYREPAYILDINLANNTIMIGRALDTDYEMQTRVFIKEDTEIIVDARQSSIKSLAVGEAILITYTDGIMESAPAQMHHPTQIEVIKPYTQTVYILDINLEYNYIMTGDSLDTDYMEQTKVLLKDSSTSILINGSPARLEYLTVGSKISLTSTGDILESAPAQMPYPLQIEVLE